MHLCGLSYSQRIFTGTYVSRLFFPPVAVIGFVKTAYTVNEVQDMDSEMDVCVHLLSGTIAPGVSVDYSLDYIDDDADQGMLRWKSWGVPRFAWDEIAHV